MSSSAQGNRDLDGTTTPYGRQISQFDLDAVLAEAREEIERTAVAGPDMCWEVFPPHEDATEAFRIDLGRLAKGSKHPAPVVTYLRQARKPRLQPMRRSVFDAELTCFLASAIKRWSLDKSKRTAAECLSLLKFFFQFYRQLVLIKK